MTIDLPNQTVIAPDGARHTFDISPLRKDRLIRGVDDIDVTLEYLGQDRGASRRQRGASLPWLPAAGANSYQIFR